MSGTAPWLRGLSLVTTVLQVRMTVELWVDERTDQGYYGSYSKTCEKRTPLDEVSLSRDVLISQGYCLQISLLSWSLYCF
jgi:hypothetical protein